MECNKNDAELCLRKAHEYVAQGNLEKAIKMAKKSKRLYPSSEADSLLNRLSKQDNNTPNNEHNNNSNNNNNNIRNRKRNNNNNNNNNSSSNSTQHKDEQLDIVLRATDYYDVLSVSKDASLAQIKRSYRKLALRFHPDKNDASKAEEAFKKVNAAYACLSDKQKRERYDRYGLAGVEPGAGGPGGASPPGFRGAAPHGFRFYTAQGGSDFFTDDDLNNVFESFFHAMAEEQMAARRQRYRGRRQQQPQPAPAGWGLLGLILQVIFVFVLMVLPSLLSSPQPVFSFTQNDQYTEPHNIRLGKNVDDIVYYVKTGQQPWTNRFERANLERTILRQYVDELRRECKQEKMHFVRQKRKETTQGDPREEDEESSCNRLYEVIRTVR